MVKGSVTPRHACDQAFSVVRLRSGYDLADADAFLARVETALSRLWQDNAATA